MKQNNHSLQLLKRDLIRSVVVIFCLVVAIMPIYLKCSDVVYDNLQTKLQRDIEFGSNRIENEINVQNVMIEKLKKSPIYNYLKRKSSSAILPEENVTLNEIQSYYSTLCGALFIQDRTILLFNKNDIMIEKNSICAYAMDVYGYQWKFENLDYNAFKKKLFEKDYFGEFPADMKFQERDDNKFAYIKTIGSDINGENSVMISIFDIDQILKQCSLEEIAESGNIYIKNWNEETIAASEKTKNISMKIEHRFSSIPITVIAEISNEYVASQMAGVRRIIVIYFSVALLVVIMIVLLYAYKHWKMINEMAEIFDKKELFDKNLLNLDHKFVKEYNNKLETQKRKMDEIMAEKLFADLLNTGLRDDELSVLKESLPENLSEICLIMLKLETIDIGEAESLISRFYEGHMNVVLHAKTDLDTVVLLIDAKSLNVTELKKLAHSMIYSDNINIRIALSRTTDELSKLTETNRQMKNVIAYLENSTFIQMDEIKRDEEYDRFISFEYTKQLYEHITNGNARLAVRHVYEQWYYLTENPGVNDEISKLFYWQYGVIAQLAAELGYDGKLPMIGHGKKILDIVSEVIAVVEKLAMLSNEKKGVGLNRAEQIVHFIDENCYNSQFYMQTLCDEFDLSERSISEIIKNKTGVRFSDYISARRINRAEKLLSTTDLSINDISTMCGFASNNAFYKAFKRVHVISPTQYRAETNDKNLIMEADDVF